ncbi:MAG TPA: hypothetical protein VJT31_05320 [Rugosimonospora sp.]|nr:hypothetical protein [Rugosimonospora sp.]
MRVQVTNGPADQRTQHDEDKDDEGRRFIVKRVVAVIPAGVGLDAAIAVLRGLGECYPAASLSLGTDAGGGMRVVQDPEAAEAAAPAARVEVSLGVDDAADLLTFAFGADDQADAARALALALVGMLEDAGAANYLTYTVEVPGTGRYALTVQRCGSLTPAEHIADLQAQLAERG